MNFWQTEQSTNGNSKQFSKGFSVKKPYSKVEIPEFMEKGKDKMYVLPESYLSADVAKGTTYKSVADAYDRNLFSVIQRGGIFYVEGYGCSDRTYKLVIKETKRLFPILRYLYD